LTAPIRFCEVRDFTAETQIEKEEEKRSEGEEELISFTPFLLFLPLCGNLLS
jgi:hypothetical protein